MEAENVLPHINRMQAAKRAEKCRVLFLVMLAFDLDIQTRPSKDQTRLPCEFGSNLLSSPEMFHTQTKKSQCQKQNLNQFTACGNKKASIR